MKDVYYNDGFVPTEQAWADNFLRGGHPVTLQNYVATAYGLSKRAGWWDGVDVNNPYVVATKLCLIHSEISEAMEGHRKKLMDEKLPERPAIEVELADALIRIFDLAGALDLDLEGAVLSKMEYNQSRADHKPENRAAEGGKTY